MGRPRSDYICPRCGKQGSRGQNSTRNGNYPNARMHKYLRVTHYDSTTRKRTTCYVDNIIKRKKIEDYKKRPFAELLLNLNEIQENYFPLSERCKRIAEKISGYDITPEEDKTLALAFRKELEIASIFEKIAVLQELKIISILNGIECPKVDIVLNELVEGINNILFKQSNIEKEQNPREIIKQAIDVMKSDPFVMGINYLFNKYEKPKRDAKRKALSKKLSESAFGSDKYPNDYSGIMN